VFIDIENAVPTDFCLIELETTLAVPLRIDLVSQITVSREQLVGYLGHLTTKGEDTLRQVVNGEVMVDRTGPSLEGEDDPRLTARRETARVIRLLGSPRARLVEETEESDEPALAPRVVWLRVIASAEAAGATAKLAAASQPSLQVFEVAMETAVPGVEFAGKLRYNPRTDAISLSLQKAIGLGDHARAVLYTVNHAARTSLPFAPEPGRDVELVNNWGVFINEVTRIELRTG
jgi:hypothetical protein